MFYGQINPFYHNILNKTSVPNELCRFTYECQDEGGHEILEAVREISEQSDDKRLRHRRDYGQIREYTLLPLNFGDKDSYIKITNVGFWSELSLVMDIMWNAQVITYSGYSNDFNGILSAHPSQRGSPKNDLEFKIGLREYERIQIDIRNPNEIPLRFDIRLSGYRIAGAHLREETAHVPSPGFPKEVIDKAWGLAEEIMGIEYATQLKNHNSIYIVARNGITYELKPTGGIINQNTGESYCLQLDYTGERYPLPDILTTKYKWITERPDEVEKKANKFPGTRSNG